MQYSQKKVSVVDSLLIAELLCFAVISGASLANSIRWPNLVYLTYHVSVQGCCREREGGPIAQCVDSWSQAGILSDLYCIHGCQACPGRAGGCRKLRTLLCNAGQNSRKKASGGCNFQRWSSSLFYPSFGKGGPNLSPAGSSFVGGYYGLRHFSTSSCWWRVMRSKEMKRKMRRC